MEFTNTGIWITSNPENHVTDYKLADSLISIFIDIKSEIGYYNFPVIDMGCGLAGYTNHFLANGVETLSIDGNPHLASHVRGRYEVKDLVKDRFDESSPIVIPKNMISDALFNLRRVSHGYLIASWATPDQGGPNQLNPLSKDSFIQNIRDMGYKYHTKHTEFLKHNCVMPWLKNTITVFESL